jgi:ATP-dependent DNA helicase DinG
MLTSAEIENLFGPDGRTAEVLEDYEPRQAQADMAAAVAGALAQGRHLLAEAGTGVGKSLAYLVPVLDRALETGGRALVSTHTLSLQDQCVRKDLPAALKILGKEAKAVVAACGRN